MNNVKRIVKKEIRKGKIKMFRYEKLGQVISVKLNNGYKVIAFANYKLGKEVYEVKFYIKWNDIDIFDEASETEIKCDRSSLYETVAGFVETIYKDGVFDKYIERYEYQQRCFEIGNDILRKKKLGM